MSVPREEVLFREILENEWRNGWTCFLTTLNLYVTVWIISKNTSVIKLGSSGRIYIAECLDERTLAERPFKSIQIIRLRDSKSWHEHPAELPEIYQLLRHSPVYFTVEPEFQEQISFSTALNIRKPGWSFEHRVRGVEEALLTENFRVFSHNCNIYFFESLIYTLGIKNIKIYYDCTYFYTMHYKITKSFPYEINTFYEL